MKRLPNDRGFVDQARKIVDSWHGVFKGLEQLLQITPEDFTTLQTLIRAAQDSEAEGDDTTNIFELPINTEPLPSEDYVVGWKSSDSDARRFPLSLFKPVFISTTTPSGSSFDISIPSGYTDILLVAQGLSASSNGFISIGFSEDGGTTLLDQAVDIFRNGASQNGLVSATVGTWTVGAANASSAIYGRTLIRNYTSATVKLVQEDNFNFISGSSVAGWAGGRLLTNSVGPIDTARFTAAAGTFDAGTIELWGMP